MDSEENLNKVLLAATGAAMQIIGLVHENARESEEIDCVAEPDDEVTDEEEDSSFLMLSCIVCTREAHPRQSEHMEVIESYSDADFWCHFRVTRSTFQKIIQTQKDLKFRSEVVYHGGWQPLSLEMMLHVVLFYLANQGAIRLIADKFDFCESTVWQVVRVECQWFFDNQAKFIRWPTGDNARAVSRQFQRKCGFPGVIGAIDGCHIRVPAPSSNRNAYLNYKRFHSVVLMAVCLPNRSFSYIFTGFPGSCHDAYVFQRSSLFRQLDSHDCGHLIDSRKYHLVGDSAFPLKNWLMVPYKDHEDLSASWRLYNEKHSGSRIVIEQAFGDLKNRFRRCQYIDATIPNCVNVIAASCAIHNICIENGDFCIERENLSDSCEQNPVDVSFFATNSGNAKREIIRDKLARLFL